MHKSLLPELKEKFAQVLEEGVFSGGEETRIFSEEVADFLNVPFIISCSNGTDALEMALKVLGVGFGDEVLVPALTWVSTAEAVVNVGAYPVFVDVAKDGLMEIKAIPKHVTSKTKAVIPVHLYGKMVDMESLSVMSTRFGLKVIEDAAQAFGAVLRGKSAGIWGDIGCFSFYPTKNLGALGEAGLMITNKEELAEKLNLLMNHGQEERDRHVVVGRNAKMDTLHAAMLRVKLRHFPEWQKRRKHLASIYSDRLAEIEGLDLPGDMQASHHNAHLFTVRTERRDELKAYLAKNGVGTAIHYPAILPHLVPFSSSSSDFPMALSISQTTLSLPLHPFLEESEVSEVCETILGFFARS